MLQQQVDDVHILPDQTLAAPGKIDLHHYSIKNQTSWMVFVQKHYSMHQVTKQWETYAMIAEELQEMKNWLHKCYEAEVDAEIQEVEQCCGDPRRMSSPRNSSDQHPGNETLFIGTDKKGTHQPGVKICLAGSESYPDEGNNLSCQWRQESESLERKKYTLSQDEGACPRHVHSVTQAHRQIKERHRAGTHGEEVHHSRGRV